MSEILIRVCVGACAGIVAAVGILVVRDEWLDRNVRLGGVFGILIGVGSLLHAVGVW